MTLTAEQEPSADAALVAAYRRGDERAAEELVLRHAPALGRYLYAAGADRDEVEDLVQETLFRAFRALSGWRGGTSLRGWLFTIGANLLRDEFRRRKGRLTVVLDDGDLLDSADPHAELTAA